jgi:hypothetical protein
MIGCVLEELQDEAADIRKEEPNHHPNKEEGKGVGHPTD